MYRSDSPQNPAKPRGGKHDPPPNPEDRYAPSNTIRIDLVDVNGTPVVIALSPRAASDLADKLWLALCEVYRKAGAK